jgi:hypothetical protein
MTAIRADREPRIHAPSAAAATVVTTTSATARVLESMCLPQVFA